jgi:phage gp36-like protein
MGRYVAWTDIAGRYPDAVKRAGDSVMGSYWLDKAEYEIDAFLAPKYTVPFTPAHPVVQDLCMDLTYYKMIIQQGEKADGIWKYIDFRIKAILNGTMLLTTSGTVIASQSGVSWSEAEGHHTSFGPDDPVEWAISSQWMQDVEDERAL